jgi:hypothetical protein
MPKPKSKPSKSKAAKPLTISIHGDGIDIDVNLSDDTGWRRLLSSFQTAAGSVRTPPFVETPGPRVANDISGPVLDYIEAAQTADLDKIDAVIELAKQAVSARRAQAAGAASKGTTPSA